MNSLKSRLPWIAALAAVAAVAATLLPPRNPGAMDVTGFSRLPVLADGRIKPFDTIARSSLLMIYGKQALALPDGAHLTAEEWLLDVFFAPEKADSYEIFTIDNPDLMTLVGKDAFAQHHERKLLVGGLGFGGNESPGLQSYSFKQIQPFFASIESQAKLADPVDPQARTPFQRSVLQLRANLSHYIHLEHALAPADSPDFLNELLRLQDQLPKGVAAVRAKEAGQPHDEAAAQAIVAQGQRFLSMAEGTDILAVPPDEDSADPNAWHTAGQGLLESFGRGQLDPTALAYAGMGFAWKQQQPEQFNHLVTLYRESLERRFARELRKCEVEMRFNAAQPFYSSMLLYVTAFLIAIVSWLRWPETLGRVAFSLVAVAWVVATSGIATRMWLEGRPPVTNLYSSALFIGWGSVGLCLILESVYRNGIGSASAGLIGFATLLIAHHLALAGDTLEMMRAVLDSNFWLGTHVVAVSTGYAATFLSGMLGLIYIFRGVFTRSLDRATADSLARMVYGIVCFATLFSFVGTVLGGIWADQSWGRFWGWDPKENGALIIVLWNALILHARWGGMVRQRGLMCLAVFGNIVTSWSWFGTNMLGIGLHSYGFTEAAFWWLSAFVLSQLAVIAVANLPLERWRSFAAR